MACYSVQTGVDTGSRMIANFHVHDIASGCRQMYGSIEMSRKDLELEMVNAIADKGCESTAGAVKRFLNGTAPGGGDPGSGGVRVPAGLGEAENHAETEGHLEIWGHPCLFPATA